MGRTPRSYNSGSQRRTQVIKLAVYFLSNWHSVFQSLGIKVVTPEMGRTYNHVTARVGVSGLLSVVLSV